MRSCVKGSFWIGFLLLLLSCSSSSREAKERMFTITEGELRRLGLSYYSDYFSFVGSDRRGSVAFALDNNRGQDGDSFQAEHFAALHDGTAGWQHVAGSGRYDNVLRQLGTIPDSASFSFTGSVQSGMVIRSEPNGLTLRTAPMRFHLVRKRGLAEYRLGSAEATLLWRERRLTGRVIYEYIFMPAFNRLTRTYPGAFRDYHGIYASVENTGDFYLHRQKGAFFSPLIEPAEGFLFLGGEGYQLSSLHVRVLGRSLAWGFYRWPLSWEGGFEAGPDRYEFFCGLSDRKTMSNWVIGGFSMGIVKGRLVSSRGTWTFYGLGEMIL
jgi:hypothetical protein